MSSLFPSRHIGPNEVEIQQMLAHLAYADLDSFLKDVIPETVRASKDLELSACNRSYTEQESLKYFRELAAKNKVWRSFIGAGYYGNYTPTVIQRNILENPGWYTQYTPYQPEISQGRLEALFNFQSMVTSLTGLPIANASLLDEATAAAEAMSMAYHKLRGAKSKFFVDADVFPQTLAVLKTRAQGLGIEIVDSFNEDCFGVLLQYPAASGELNFHHETIQAAKQAGAVVCLASDLLALCLLKSPAELGADITFGSAARFGVPLGYGGPHAAFFACSEYFKRMMPGRLVGLSKDRLGRPAYRLALQTREQHIRREKATSNICTAQVLLAIMSGMYAVYHGPENLKDIARRVNSYARRIQQGLVAAKHHVLNQSLFDTITVQVSEETKSLVKTRAEERQVNLGYWNQDCITIAIDETFGQDDLAAIAEIFSIDIPEEAQPLSESVLRQDAILDHKVFSACRSETEFIRYLKRLESKDLSLINAMIPLGSCTMKLNATTELMPVSFPEFANIHPLVPEDQVQGYQEMFQVLETALEEVTGFDAVSLQPNAGSQGEYAGLLAIKAFQQDAGQGNRDICLIPTSAHGTNPSSAVLAGLKVVTIDCDSRGNIDLADLEAKAEQYADRLSALMVTYPSTFGVFEETIKDICGIVHAHGGQVYLDGANLNAMVGLAYPAELGADVMHINLHKTFCIPHGGGGPGVGPIAVKEHLADYLPGKEKSFGPVSAAEYGSASILPISLAYILMMGPEQLRKASAVAILNANYIAKRLEEAYPALYRGAKGFVAHECVLDCRPFKEFGIEVEDIAKRLIDYGFHAPTVSWPVPGTLMVEPTESESLAELDRFCEAMLSIFAEIQKVSTSEYSKSDNPLKMAPHTSRELCSDWPHEYSRQIAAYPSGHQEEFKFWPAVARIDGVYGDRNLVCACS